jgi:hypothetical protein
MLTKDNEACKSQGCSEASETERHEVEAKKYTNNTDQTELRSDSIAISIYKRLAKCQQHILERSQLTPKIC